MRRRASTSQSKRDKRLHCKMKRATTIIDTRPNHLATPRHDTCAAAAIHSQHATFYELGREKQRSLACCSSQNVHGMFAVYNMKFVQLECWFPVNRGQHRAFGGSRLCSPQHFSNNDPVANLGFLEGWLWEPDENGGVSAYGKILCIRTLAKLAMYKLF